MTPASTKRANGVRRIVPAHLLIQGSVPAGTGVAIAR
jgi:hypothetical protein